MGSLFQTESKVIPFNKPRVVGTELGYVQAAMKNNSLCGDGHFTRQCRQWLEKLFGGGKVFLTTSCTTALDMAAILTDVKPGDEVIVPSYTFVSTVNAFVLRGANPVFIDVEEGTMNMDPTKIEAAITPKTRVIVPVHYGAIGCDMDAIMSLAEKHSLLVVEDAAQCIGATYKTRALGSIGHIGCFSFHETKNLTAGGQGGAILINDARLFTRAEIVHDNGTNRRQFFRGEVDRYEWIDIGSNFFMTELQAAYLWAQLEAMEETHARRNQLWTSYRDLLRPLANAGHIRFPPTLDGREHNGHKFYFLLRDVEQRDAFSRHMKEGGIAAIAHYVPLHPRPLGQKLGRFAGEDRFTTSESNRLVRLPMFYDLTDEDQEVIAARAIEFFGVDKVT
ncbi:MAG: hypothetical protein M1816_004687 [Peltula sp. TS41687]|nr:MAG: hypothetical protein M1816_004687 [Peltula sp. TS41687]